MRPQSFEAFQCLLRTAVGLCVRQKTIQRFGQRVMHFLPFFPEHGFCLPFTGQFARLETDEYRRLPVAPDNDGGFVFLVADNHGRIVTFGPRSSAFFQKNPNQ